MVCVSYQNSKRSRGDDDKSICLEEHREQKEERWLMSKRDLWNKA